MVSASSSEFEVGGGRFEANTATATASSLSLKTTSINSGAFGGALSVQFSGLSVTDCSSNISNSQTGGSGMFKFNTASSGISFKTTTSSGGCNMYTCSATAFGGAVAVSFNGKLRLTTCSSVIQSGNFTTNAASIDTDFTTGAGICYGGAVNVLFLGGSVDNSSSSVFDGNYVANTASGVSDSEAGSLNDFLACGGAISVRFETAISLSTDFIISNCSSTIATSSSGSDVNDVGQFIGNSAHATNYGELLNYASGGAVYVLFGGDSTITNCRSIVNEGSYIRNSANAIGTTRGGSLSITSLAQGGAISVRLSGVLINDCHSFITGGRFAHNAISAYALDSSSINCVATGGAVSVDFEADEMQSCSSKLTGGAFTSNTASSSAFSDYNGNAASMGGAVYILFFANQAIYQCNTDFRFGNYSNNSALASAVYSSDGSPLGSSVSSSSSANGGAVSVDFHTLTGYIVNNITNCEFSTLSGTFHSNFAKATATDFDGISNSVAQGGATSVFFNSVLSSRCNFSIQAGSYADNVATSSIGVGGSGSSKSYGGAVCFFSQGNVAETDISVADVLFVNNSLTNNSPGNDNNNNVNVFGFAHGGALSAFMTSNISHSNMLVANCTFFTNSAGVHGNGVGGAVSFFVNAISEYSTYSIEQGDFSLNSVVGGTPDTGFGGSVSICLAIALQSSVAVLNGTY